MALHPVNDRMKIEITRNEYGFGDGTGTETGVVVEVPPIMIYLSFHSFAFEKSLGDVELMSSIQTYYEGLVGKRIYWEALQDRGRIFKEGEKEYVYLQMTDVLAVADDVNDKAEIVTQVGSAGSFNL